MRPAFARLHPTSWPAARPSWLRSPWGLMAHYSASALGVLRVPAIHVRMRSALGAGDSFLGAMVWALSEGRTPEEAFRLGIAAGAAAVMKPGFELCRREEVLALNAAALSAVARSQTH
ncbi:PfkB family carbohydrate kinase [Mesorhizobium atlanticum]